MGVIFVTHDLGVAGEVADRMAVMYAGRFVEEGPVGALMRAPLHPYSRGLLGATVHEAARGTRLTTIRGAPPNLERLAPGCAFAPRCDEMEAACLADVPGLRGPVPGQAARCIHVRGCGMLIYLLRRVLYAVPIALAVSLVCFMLVHIAPGDPISAIVPADAPQAVVEQVRREYGLDKPLAGAVRVVAVPCGAGGFGEEPLATGRPVWSELRVAVVNTLRLAVVASVLGFVLGCLLGGAGRGVPGDVGGPGGNDDRGGGGVDPALLAGDDHGDRVQRAAGGVAGDGGRAVGGGGVELGLGARAAFGAAGRDAVRDPDGDHHPDYTRAGGGDDEPGLRDDAAREGDAGKVGVPACGEERGAECAWR